MLAALKECSLFFYYFFGSELIMFTAYFCTDFQAMRQCLAAQYSIVTKVH